MTARLLNVSPQILSRIPFDDYRAMPGLSISDLKPMDRSPLHYLYSLDHPKTTDPMRLGTAAHTAVLEPERFEAQFAIWSRRSEKTGNLCPRNGQYWDAFVGEHPGQEIITEDQADDALAIQAAVRGDKYAMKYLEYGDPEVSIFWQRGDRKCRARVDWLTSGPVLVGLKTARDCRNLKFGSAAAKLGYPLQWAWYHDGFSAIHGESPRVVEIVVESEPPHAVKVFEITQDIIAQGRDNYERLLQQLEQCEATGEYPGPGEDGEEQLVLPSYYYEQYDDITDLGLVT